MPYRESAPFCRLHRNRFARGTGTGPPSISGPTGTPSGASCANTMNNVRRDVEECAHEAEETGNGFTGSGMKDAH